MKRLVFATACLAIGACTTMATAWLAAIFSPLSASSSSPLVLASVVPSTWGEPSIGKVFRRGLGTDAWQADWILYKKRDDPILRGDESVREVRAHAADPPDLSVLIVHLEGGRCGWPWRALHWRSSSDGPAWKTATRSFPIPPSPESVILPGIEPLARVTTGAGGSRPVPIRPLSLGFIGDTILFASIAAAIGYLVPAIRRARRIRAGKCVRCAYDVRGLATCPECGTSTSHPSPPSQQRNTPPPNPRSQ